MPRSSARTKTKRETPEGADVFLNIPYDDKFNELFLSYVSGLMSLGFFPRTTVEVPGGERRLDRILNLIERCPYSLHDLSRVEVSGTSRATPRFNMPFELGLTVAHAKHQRGRHTWFVFEARAHRIEKSLSDLSGTDVYIHGGRPLGVFRQLSNAFMRSNRQPDVQTMALVLKGLRGQLPELMRKVGARSPFEARAFDVIRSLARALSQEYGSI